MKITVTLNKLNKIIQKIEALKKIDSGDFLVDRNPGPLLHGSYQGYLEVKNKEITNQSTRLVREMDIIVAKHSLKSLLLSENVKSGIHDLLTSVTVNNECLSKFNTVKPHSDEEKRLIDEATFNDMKASLSSKASYMSSDYVCTMDKPKVDSTINSIQKQINDAQDKIAELNYSTKVEIELEDSLAKELGLQ